MLTKPMMYEHIKKQERQNMKNAFIGLSGEIALLITLDKNCRISIYYTIINLPHQVLYWIEYITLGLYHILLNIISYIWYIIIQLLYFVVIYVPKCIWNIVIYYVFPIILNTALILIAIIAIFVIILGIYRMYCMIKMKWNQYYKHVIICSNEVKLMSEWSNNNVKEWILNSQLSHRIDMDMFNNIDGNKLMKLNNKKLKTLIPNNVLRNVFKKMIRNESNKVFRVNILITSENVIQINATKETTVYELKCQLLNKINKRGKVSNVILRYDTVGLPMNDGVKMCK